MIFIAVIYSILAAVGLLGIYFFQGQAILFNAFKIGPAGPDNIGAGKIFGLAVITGAGVIGLSAISSRWFEPARVLEAEFRNILGPLNIKEIFLMACFSGIGEEIFFRGALQPKIGLIPTALLFGLLHFPVNKKYLIWTIFAVGMGFLLGWLYLYTGSLLTPILTHFIINLVNLYRLCINKKPLS